MSGPPAFNMWWSYVKKHFVYKETESKGETNMHGLLKKLETLYYPTYSYELARHGGTDDEKKTSRPTKYKGLAYGSFIDKQIRLVIEFVIKKKLTIDAFLSRSDSLKKRKSSGFTPELLKELNQTRRRLKLKRGLSENEEDMIHKIAPFTRRVLVSMRLMKLQPLAAQVPVGSKEGRIGTAIDVLCTKRGPDGTLHLVVCEIKTGYEGVYEKHTNSNMKAPFGDSTDSPLRQHQLQLLATSMLFLNRFPQVSHVDAIILRVFSGGVKIFSLDGFWTTNSKIIKQLWTNLTGHVCNPMECQRNQCVVERTVNIFKRNYTQ